MKELKQIAKENNFSHKNVTAEEFEDGIGAGVGDNFIRTENNIPVWYTEAQLIEELNLPELQVKSVTLDAKKISVEQGKKMAIDWLKSQNAVWFYFIRAKVGFGGSGLTITVAYGK